MKIAIFSDCYLDLTGGITSSINAQKAALEKAGHTIYIFSTGYPKPIKELKKLASQNIFQVPSCKYLFRNLTPISRRPKIIEKWLLHEHPEIKDFDVYYKATTEEHSWQYCSTGKIPGIEGNVDFDYVAGLSQYKVAVNTTKQK